MNPREVYKLLMFLQSMDNLKRSIVVALAHVFPTQVTISQLSAISGYSSRSKYLYRTGVVKELLKEGILVGTKLTQNIQVLQLNQDDPLMQMLIELCSVEGEQVSRSLHAILKEVRT